MFSQKSFKVCFLLSLVLHTSLSFPAQAKSFENRFFSSSTCRCGERDDVDTSLLPTHGSVNLKNLTRIHGGKDAQLGDEKWMAMIVTNAGGLCTGSLLNNKMVLTAAHCVTNRQNVHEVLPATAFRIWLNRRTGPVSPVNAGSELHFAKQIIIHPSYDGDSLRYDGAIIVLEDEINFDESPVRPICLPSTSDYYDLPGRSDGIAFGYGRIDGGSQEELPANLQQGSVTYLDLNVCVLNFNKVLRALGESHELSVEEIDTHICSSGFSQGATVFVFYGDSGGPVTLPIPSEIGNHMVQMGITSGGNTHLIPLAMENDLSISYEHAVELYADIFRILPLIESVSDSVNATWCAPQ